MRHQKFLFQFERAGGRHIDGVNDFGCRILVIFKGAGFDFPFVSSASLADWRVARTSLFDFLRGIGC